MNNKLITDLAKLAKVSDVEAFAEALKSETDTDFQLDIESLVVRTKDEDETYKTNISKEVKDKAFSDAFEIQIKNMKKEVGLEFDGKKSKDFIDAFKTQILDNANIEPNNRISELESSLTNTSKSLQEKELEIENIKSGFHKEKTRLKAESLIPELPKGLGLDKKEATDLFFMNYEVKSDGVYKGDVRLVNQTTAEPFKLEEVVNTFVSDRGWNKQPSGRGGAGGGTGGSPSSISTLDEFNLAASEKGFNVGSKDYNAFLAEVVKENPEIVV